MAKNIRIAFLGGRSGPLEDLEQASHEELDGEIIQLPLYIEVDNDNLVIYYCNEPFTLEEAQAVHEIPHDDE